MPFGSLVSLSCSVIGVRIAIQFASGMSGACVCWLLWQGVAGGTLCMVIITHSFIYASATFSLFLFALYAFFPLS
jgi:hypothetical protein